MARLDGEQGDIENGTLDGIQNTHSAGIHVPLDSNLNVLHRLAKVLTKENVQPLDESVPELCKVITHPVPVLGVSCKFAPPQ
jgi:hypothetical protein